MSFGGPFIILFCFLLALEMCLATESSKNNIWLLYLFELRLYGLTHVVPGAFVDITFC